MLFYYVSFFSIHHVRNTVLSVKFIHFTTPFSIKKNLRQLGQCSCSAEYNSDICTSLWQGWSVFGSHSNDVSTSEISWHKLDKRMSRKTNWRLRNTTELSLIFSQGISRWQSQARNETTVFNIITKTGITKTTHSDGIAWKGKAAWKRLELHHWHV